MEVKTKLRVRIEGEKGVFEKPYPAQVLETIFLLSGRKSWKNKETVFDASPANIRLIKSHFPQCKFVHVEKTDIRENLENLLTQNDDLPPLKTKYKPGMKWKPLQVKTLQQCHGRKVFAHLHDPGAGKTAIMIAECGMLFQEKKITGVLISAPNKVDAQWIKEQIPTHISKSVKYKAEVWNKKPLDKFWGRKSRLEFLAMNVDSFRTQKGQDVAIDFIERHGGKVMMIVDESHEIKNASSQRSKGILDIGSLCDYRRIATGTLFGASIFDAWAQFKFLNWRILGHKYQTSFKNEFCIMGGFEGRQIVADKNQKVFWDLIAPHCFRASESEIRQGKITSKTVVHKYDLNKRDRARYDKLVKTCLAEIDNQIVTTAKNGLALILRTQQMLCGFLQDQESGELNEFSNKRLSECYKIIKAHPGPKIVWAIFRPDYERLKWFLEKKGLKVGIYSGTKKHCLKIKEQFKNGDLDVMVVNPASGGTGENFQGACLHDIYFSYNYNQFHHWQSMKRIDRDGAHGLITHHIIAARATTNIGILGNLNRKARRSKITLDEIRGVLCCDSSDENIVETKTQKPKTKVSKSDLERLGI